MENHLDHDPSCHTFVKSFACFVTCPLLQVTNTQQPSEITQTLPGICFSCHLKISPLCALCGKKSWVMIREMSLLITQAIVQGVRFEMKCKEEPRVISFDVNVSWWMSNSWEKKGLFTAYTLHRRQKKLNKSHLKHTLQEIIHAFSGRD